MVTFGRVQPEMRFWGVLGSHLPLSRCVEHAEGCVGAHTHAKTPGNAQGGREKKAWTRSFSSVPPDPTPGITFTYVRRRGRAAALLGTGILAPMGSRDAVPGGHARTKKNAKVVSRYAWESVICTWGEIKHFCGECVEPPSLWEVRGGLRRGLRSRKPRASRAGEGP